MNDATFSARTVDPTGLRIEDFPADKPYRQAPAPAPASFPGLIDGVTVTPLVAHGDERGTLSELLTTRDGEIEPILHVYQVLADAGSVRAWVYHRRQFDRLAFTRGAFEIVLYDIRPDSPSQNTINVLNLGESSPHRLRIPPFVIHGVRNAGSMPAAFVNMPTQPWLPDDPDKCRIPWDDPRVPHSYK